MESVTRHPIFDVSNKKNPYKMTTYPTISEAFKNGSGDVFFANTERTKFFAISRHLGVREISGFDCLSYSETLSLAEIQKPEPVAKLVEEAPKKPAKMVDTSRAYSFYDEYPDAYGQNL